MPRGPPGTQLHGIGGLIDRGPMPVFRLIAVRIEQSVFPICTHQFGEVDAVS